MTRYGLTISLAFLCSGVIAQTNRLFIDGVVRNEKDDAKLEAAKVILTQEGEQFEKIITKSTGRFEFRLPLEAVYLVTFSKKGYVSKRISIEAINIPPEDAEFGFEFGGWNVKLFKEIDGLDISILDKPIARIIYDTTAHEFTYDKDYIELVKNELAELKKELKREQKRLLAEQKAAAKKAEQERLAAAKAEAKSLAEERARKEKAAKEKAAAEKALAQKKEKARKEEKKLAAKQAAAERKQRELEAAKKLKASNQTKKSGSDTDKKTDEKIDKSSEEFQQALAKKYPEGITEERYKEGNINYIRRIVVKGSKGAEYLSAQHPWGGKYYFKNGESITERLWKIETEK